MNIIKLSKQKHLETQYTRMTLTINQAVLGKRYISGKVISSKLNDDGDPIFGIEVVEKINDTTMITKRLEYTVVNDNLYPTLPLNPLCDTQG